MKNFHLEVNNFSDHFSFHTVNYKDTEVKNTHIHTLDKIFDIYLSQIQKLFLLFLIPASRIILQLQYHTFALVKTF